jgi:hypothetical protein
MYTPLLSLSFRQNPHQGGHGHPQLLHAGPVWDFGLPELRGSPLDNIFKGWLLTTGALMKKYAGQNECEKLSLYEYF